MNPIILYNIGQSHPAVRHVTSMDLQEGEDLNDAAGRIVSYYEDAVIVDSLPEAPQELWRVNYETGKVTFAEEAEPVPQSVTMRQARLALLQAGLLAQVDAAIDALPEPDRTAARIEWEYSQEVQRDKPFVQMLAPALGLDDKGLDNLFRIGATL